MTVGVCGYFVERLRRIDVTSKKCDVTGKACVKSNGTNFIECGIYVAAATSQARQAEREAQNNGRA